MFELRLLAPEDRVETLSEALDALMSFAYNSNTFNNGWGAMDRAVWGPGPFGFHLTSVLLHMLNVALVSVLATLLWSDAARRRTAAAGDVRAATDRKSVV